MESLLEIAKYTLPALVVFATAYYILQGFFRNQLATMEMEMNKDIIASKIPIKLQAYERLILFCERIKLSNLVMRLRTNNMTNQQLQDSILISVQKEYEHNLVQQLYTSKNLWRIIELAKDETLNAVASAMNELDANQNASQLSNLLMGQGHQRQNDPVELAINAVKEEAKLILR